MNCDECRRGRREVLHRKKNDNQKKDSHQENRKINFLTIQLINKIQN